jgi:DNA processing protein
MGLHAELESAPRFRVTRGYTPPEPSTVRVVSLETLLGGTRSVPRPRQVPLEGTSESTRLWCAGDTGLVTRPSVAVIGTRGVSDAGAARARRLARELAERGVVVVSGLARGVDTEALRGAIQAGGKVVAVIGTPLEQAYPAENATLQREIHEKHLLVSQFPPGARVFPSNFPARNKVMATLSDASVIIEASDSSGTLGQAAECVRLGRWLFIAATVLADSSLTWPARFRNYEKMRPLTSTEDVLGILPQ